MATGCSLQHIKKERHHGARHGNTEAKKECHISFNAWKRSRERVDGHDEHYEGIHDRFQRDPAYRDSQLRIGWTEEKCIAMGKLAQEDCPSSEENKRYRKNWYISLNKSGKNAPMRLQSDFRTAVTIVNRVHRESGEERPEPIPFHQYQRKHSSFSSSSSSSWWQWDKNWWSS